MVKVLFLHVSRMRTFKRILSTSYSEATTLTTTQCDSFIQGLPRSSEDRSNKVVDFSSNISLPAQASAHAAISTHFRTTHISEPLKIYKFKTLSRTYISVQERKEGSNLAVDIEVQREPHASPIIANQ